MDEMPLMSQCPYHDTNVIEQRASILAAVNWGAHLVQVDKLFSKVLPPLPNGINIHNVVLELQRNGALTTGPDGKLCWTSMKEEPKKSEGNENEVFKVLVTIFEKICETVKALKPDLEAQFKLRVGIALSPASAMRNRARPDGALLLCGATEKSFDWHDIAIGFEFKKVLQDAKALDVSLDVRPSPHDAHFPTRASKRCWGTLTFCSARTPVGVSRSA